MFADTGKIGFLGRPSAHGGVPREGAVRMTASRKVTLRHEVDSSERRYLSASLDVGGNLVIDGQDLGPTAGMFGHDGEYGWVHTIRAEHIPLLLKLIDAPPDVDILDELEQRWSGDRSHELERRIRESDHSMPTFATL